MGETLSADRSGIADADGMKNAVFAYQWVSNDGNADTDIQDATASTYTLVDADIGRTIRVTVSFTDDAGKDETLTSVATAAAEAKANTPATGTLNISGTAQVGETLTADTSGIADEDGLENAVFSYRWLADGADISGATDSTYLPVVDDAGRAIGVRVSFTDDAGFEETLTAASVRVPADDYTVNEVWEDGNWGRVTVGGSATGVVEKPGDRDFFGVNLSRGRTYRIEVAGHGDVGALEQVRLYGVFVYAEDLECSGAYDDPGVTTYVLTAEHSAPYSVAVGAEGDGTGGYRVSVSESDDNGAGCDTAPAAAQAPNTPATGAPAVTGAARVGETLTAGTSVIADEDGLDNAVFTYQWQAGDAEISGANGNAYTLAGSDEGKAISVKVSFSDDQGNEESLTSAATEAVQARPNSPATGTPNISGTAQVGETLTADPSGIADEDGLDSVTYSYQWLTDGADLSGATDSSYTSVDADEGKAIRVRVSFTDDAGNVESLTSVATAEVAAKPNSPATGAPTISGTAQVGETLTADTSGIADADGLANVTYSYQWVVNEASDGAAGASYTVVVAEDGSTTWVPTDGTADADIEGATGPAYTLTEASAGRPIRVRVSFTDGGGNAETVISAPTLMAGMYSAPVSHDGERLHLRAALQRGVRDWLQDAAGPRLHGDRRNGEEGAAAGAGQRHRLEDHGESRRQRRGGRRPAGDHGLRRAGSHLHRGRADAVPPAGADGRRAGPVASLRTADGRASQGEVAPPFPFAARLRGSGPAWPVGANGFPRPTSTPRRGRASR